jgi:hypothetical protein
MFDWSQPVQASFSELEYAAEKRKTRRDRFLAEIEAVTPGAALLAVIEPFYPKGEGRGRPPIGLEKILHRRSEEVRLFADVFQRNRGLFELRGQDVSARG